MTPYFETPDGGVRLYLGDARDVAPQFTERGHVIMDAPYSRHVHSATTRRGAGRLHRTRGEDRIYQVADLGFDHLSAADRRMLAGHVARLSARWALAFCDVESAWLWRLSLVGAGLDYVRTGAWIKSGSTPQFSGDRPATGHEEIVIAHARGAKRWNGGGKDAVWEFPVVKPNDGSQPRIHTTQKPERLMLALVEDFTDPGDLVYDLTAGSCTTGIACMRAKGGARRFVGIERDEKFAERAAKRLEAESKGSTYHAQERGQQALFGGSA